MTELDALKLQALEVSYAGIVITNREGVLVWANSAFERLTGYSPDDMTGQTLRKLKSGHQSPDVYAELWETVLAGRVWTGQLVNKRKDGSLYYEDATITPLKDEDGQVTHFVATKHDVSSLVRAQLARDKLLTVNLKLRAALRDSYHVALTSLADMVDLIDPALGQHGRRVGELACRIAVHLNLNVDQIREIRLAGLIHDLGKLAKDYSGAEEKHVHAQRAGAFLESAEGPQSIREALLHQSERYDGMGKPRGLKGLSIPLGARIVAIASAYDQSRYVQRRSLEHTLNSLETKRGTHFDPRLLDILGKVVQDDDGADSYEDRLVSTRLLAPGMILGADLYSSNDALLYPSETVIDELAIRKLNRLSRSEGLQPFVRVRPG